LLHELSIEESNGDATHRNFANQLISDVDRIEGGSLPSKNYGMALENIPLRQTDAVGSVKCLRLLRGYFR
jgi:hypothetical protein